MIHGFFYDGANSKPGCLVVIFHPCVEDEAIAGQFKIMAHISSELNFDKHHSMNHNNVAHYQFHSNKLLSHRALSYPCKHHKNYG